MAVTSVTDATFQDEVLSSDKPVVVDFWAEWCGPCKMIAPTLDEIDSEMGGDVKIVKVNIDENQQIAVDYGIRAIPTLMMFKAGEQIGTQQGVQSKSKLVSWIQDS